MIMKSKRNPINTVYSDTNEGFICTLVLDADQWPLKTRFPLFADRI